jgi:hypothetical protein
MRVLIVYTLMASLLLSFGHATRFWYQDAPLLESQAESAWQELVESWPQNLKLRYADQTWFMTPDEPVRVSYPKAWPRPDGWPEYLLTLLPVEPEAISAIIPSLVVAGPTTLQVRSPGQDVPQTLRWSEILPQQDILLDKGRILEATPQGAVWARLAVEQITLFIFLWKFIGIWILRLLGLLFYTWLAQMLWTLRGRKYKFWSVYKMGLLIVPVAEAVMLIWQTLAPRAPLPLSFWWIWLLILAVIILTAPRKSSPAEQEL